MIEIFFPPCFLPDPKNPRTCNITIWNGSGRASTRSFLSNSIDPFQDLQKYDVWQC
jgi:hypothetical protein